ncbi:hypothetical protein IFO69_15300 [Echinicola sp. CAU 1574]|uniref:Uncharacterized protein n=1 Tax=Echinicola arenosa TaxID=2774144 RepID=A0ABR9AMT6_9BACT|nr:hypothetical protein [Echinicola arenosa]MBD8490121.1 hypothetical protein [Echinicola arenosa]
MNKFSKIALTFFLLVLTTFLLGEIEERSVAKAIAESVKNAGLGIDIHQDDLGLCWRNRPSTKEKDFHDQDHHPVKNYFIRAKSLVFVPKRFDTVMVRQVQEAIQSENIQVFSGRAPPVRNS